MELAFQGSSPLASVCPTRAHSDRLRTRPLSFLNPNPRKCSLTLEGETSVSCLPHLP